MLPSDGLGRKFSGSLEGDALLFVVYPKPPFLILPHLAKFCPRGLPVPCLYENGACRRILEIEGHLVPYKVFIASEGMKPKLTVQIFSRDKSLAGKALNKIREIYRVNFDYSRFLKRTEGTPIYPIARKHYGLRPTRMLSVYEALIDSIIEQNISLNLAMKIKAEFVRQFGEKKVLSGEEYYSFPSPRKVGRLEPATLKKKIRTTLVKANAIVEVARLAESLPTVEEIEEKPEDFLGYITRIKGVGKWTAELSMAKVSRNFNIGPYGDLAVKRGFQRTFGIQSEGEIREIMSGLEEYMGLILYLMALEGHRKR